MTKPEDTSESDAWFKAAMAQRDMNDGMKTLSEITAAAQARQKAPDHKPWYEEMYEERTGKPFPKTKIGRPRMDGLTKEDYEALGIPWTASKEYNREYQRNRRAAIRAEQLARQADIDARLEQKRALGMLPSQQPTPILPVSAPVWDPILAPDGIPWGISEAEFLALPPEEEEWRVERLQYISERDAWREGRHNRQTGRKAPDPTPD